MSRPPEPRRGAGAAPSASDRPGAAVAQIAHDLRDGLSLVRAAAQQALATPHGVRSWREDVLRIEAQSVRLGRLVDDLLDGAAPAAPAPARAAAGPRVAASVFRAGDAPRDLVLVVDDEEAICDLAVRALDDRYDVAVTGTAEEALRLAAELRPRLVVAEAVLPDARGEVLLERAREHEALADVPFLLMPASGDADEHDRIRRRGARAVLRKPFGIDELRAQVDAVLDGHPPPSSAGATPADDLDRVFAERALECVVEDRLWRAAHERHAVAVLCARVHPRLAVVVEDAWAADEALDRLRSRVRTQSLPGDLCARVEGRQLVVVAQRPGHAQAERHVAAAVAALVDGDREVQAGGVALRPAGLSARVALARARARL